MSISIYIRGLLAVTVLKKQFQANQRYQLLQEIIRELLVKQIMYGPTLLIATAVLFVCACANPFPSTTTSTTTKRSTTTTPTSPTPVVSSKAPMGEHSSQPSIRDAAVFLCGDLVYQSELSALFLPADVSVHNIINGTRAKEYNDRSIDLFCENDKLVTYVLCVNILTTYRNNAIDKQIAKYIDMSKFGSAMMTYCNNKELIKHNYECVLKVVRSGSTPCRYGGIEGLMQGVGLSVASGISKDAYCKIQSATMRCRDAQFSKCNADLAMKMASVYNDLSDKSCL